LIRFGSGVIGEAPALLSERGFSDYALLTTERALGMAPALVEGAGVVLQVPSGGVPEAAAAVRGEVGGRPVVALGGGRVVDAAKAIGGADGLAVAAIPTTLSGAEMTPFHRMPAGVVQFSLVRPSLVIADPDVMATQPVADLAASAMNAMAHAIEALYTPLTNPVAGMAGLRAVELLGHGLGDHDDPDRELLSVGAVLAGYASGVAGYAVHHVLSQTTVRVAGTPHARTNAVLLPHSLRLMEPRVPAVLTAVAAALGASRGCRCSASARTSWTRSPPPRPTAPSCRTPPIRRTPRSCARPWRTRSNPAQGYATYLGYPKARNGQGTNLPLRGMASEPNLIR
jgi:alcohol dehydrogenase class IV